MRTDGSRGTTLIVVAVGITLLGIGSALLVPRYLAFNRKSRVAAVQGFAGSVQSAASLVRGLSLATSNGERVALEGAMVTLLNHYPDPTGSGIASAVQSPGAVRSDFTFTPGHGTVTAAMWTKNGAPVPSSCAVSYTAAAEGATPDVQVLTIGC
jgi:MSHA pilin protein MshA